MALSRAMRHGLAILLVALPVAALAAAGNGWVQIPGGRFESAFDFEDVDTLRVPPFELQRRPVTNAEFLAFVQAPPEWRRDRVASVLADERYLQHWPAAAALESDAQRRQPVVDLSCVAAWRERILAWYSEPTRKVLPRAGLQAPNAYGVQDIHGLVWEWTEDFSSLLMDPESRNQGDPGKAKFCGAGALSIDDRDNYA